MLLSDFSVLTHTWAELYTLELDEKQDEEQKLLIVIMKSEKDGRAQGLQISRFWEVEPPILSYAAIYSHMEKSGQQAIFFS